MQLASGSEVDGLVIGDLNSDGRADIVAPHMYDAFIRVFHSQPGGFAPQSASCPQMGNNEVAIADLDGDGDLDVLLMSGQFTTSLHRFKQNTSGTLEPIGTFPAGALENLYDGSAVGDLDGDRLNDAVTTTMGNDPEVHLSLWLQSTIGCFGSAPILASGHAVPFNP